MMKIEELSIFIRHFDWYTKDETGYFIPTDKAPPEAVKAMEYVNELFRRDIENDMHMI